MPADYTIAVFPASGLQATFGVNRVNLRCATEKGIVVVTLPLSAWEAVAAPVDSVSSREKRFAEKRAQALTVAKEWLDTRPALRPRLNALAASRGLSWKAVWRAVHLEHARRHPGKPLGFLPHGRGLSAEKVTQREVLWRRRQDGEPLSLLAAEAGISEGALKKWFFDQKKKKSA